MPKGVDEGRVENWVHSCRTGAGLRGWAGNEAAACRSCEEQLQPRLLSHAANSRVGGGDCQNQWGKYTPAF